LKCSKQGWIRLFLGCKVLLAPVGADDLCGAMPSAYLTHTKVVISRRAVGAVKNNNTKKKIKKVLALRRGLWYLTNCKAN
jgi:hypothetical protein